MMNDSLATTQSLISALLSTVHADAASQTANDVAYVHNQTSANNALLLDVVRQLIPAFAELESALADIVAALENKANSAALLDIAAVLRTLRPTVNVVAPPANVTVDVQPTPITVEAIMPSPVVQFLPAPELSASWEVRIPGSFNSPDRLIYITRK